MDNLSVLKMTKETIKYQLKVYSIYALFSYFIIQWINGSVIKLLLYQKYTKEQCLKYY